MTVFRISSIILSVAFIIFAILNFNGVLNETLQIVMIGVGIITAVLNVISVVMWWITDKSNQYNSRQLQQLKTQNKFVKENYRGTMNMNDSTQKIESWHLLRSNKAIATKKSYPLNRDVISTLPRSGGKDYLRPSVLYRKNRL